MDASYSSRARERVKLDEIAALSTGERHAYFAVAADSLSLPGIAVVEKDFWVCWLLQKFFSLDSEFGPFTFKGGTSLSKCYALIARFSEDIDIGVERKTVGFPDDSYFYDAPSKNQRRQRVDEQNAKAFEWLHQQITPRIRLIATDVLGGGSFELVPNENAPDQLYFKYPRLSEPSLYVRPEVLIEFGTLDAWPVEDIEIIPYVGGLPQLSTLEAVRVRTIEPGRTFWEKAVILHRFAHIPDGKSFPSGKSRHYYDVTMMARSTMSTTLLKGVGLLPTIARFKDTFYPLGYARYDLAADPRSLIISPPAHLRREIEHDYQGMVDSMIFPNAKPPAFFEIEAELANLQERINASKL